MSLGLGPVLGLVTTLTGHASEAWACLPGSQRTCLWDLSLSLSS